MQEDVFELQSNSRQPRRITGGAPALLDLDGYRDEISQYRREMCELASLDPSEVFISISSWAARASEIRANVYRDESRKATAFRTREVDPFLEQCDFQFKIWSRLQAVKSFEWDLAKGQ